MSMLRRTSYAFVGVLCIAAGSTLATVAAEPNAASDKSLEAVKKDIAQGKAVLVDVRERKEWDKGHIDKAVFLPLSLLRSDIDAKLLADKLPKGKILYTHCVVGKRAATAEGILEKYGYEVRPLKAGYKELLEAGFKKAKE